MSQYRKLLRLLQKELSYQEKILSLLSEERAAIVKLNQDSLDQITTRKEKLVAESVALEHEREAVIGKLGLPETACLNSPDSPSSAFKLVLEYCKELPVRTELAKTGEELKTIVSRVKSLNEQNGGLIKQSLGLIASTMAIMRSRPGTDLPTYRQSGKMSSAGDPAFNLKSGSVSRAA